MYQKYIYQFTLTGLFFCFCLSLSLASSHREAPLIADDPLADNTDLYAFRSPDDPNTITIIANYVPLQLPHGGPNYYSFGENIRYEIHIDNNADVHGDEIIYRFTFQKVNEDPTTFFNIRLGSENLKTTYTLERSIDGGANFIAIVTNGVVPPPNIGARSIESGVGLGAANYQELFDAAITTASTNEKVFCGPVDDPFFVDLGGIFDLGDAPREFGNPQDGVECFNVSTIALQVPISTLLKTGASITPANILDGDHVIGVWASASRQQMRTLSSTMDPAYSGDWIQVSRLGMPLTNEAVIPIGQKDFWNALSPYDEITDATLDGFFYNPELALYMDDALFGGAVPSLSPLRIQEASLGGFDFTNGADGLFGLKGMAALDGTALAEPGDGGFGHLLLPAAGSPRSVDLWPVFHTGVPNLRPYQLATGKPDGDPLAAGKPFINTFLPNGGDMLRLNMAVPVTDRSSNDFNSLGLVQAAVLGLTDPTYNGDASLQAIPNMDGFPNGRRLEDDVTRIELQAVAGVVLAAIGLWYDDYTVGDPSPVTADLGNVLGYTTGVETNDKVFSSTFPFLALPHRGTDACSRVSLPLTLTVFNGYVEDKTNRLEWVTSTEQNIQWHIVERSEDGKNNWTEVGRVRSKGPSVSPKYYELEDQRPLQVAYYRLRSIDTSNRSQFSVKIFLQRAQKVDWTVQPNPATGSFEIVGNLDKAQNSFIVVTNVLGKVIHQQQTNLIGGQLATQLDCSKWVPGIYFVNLIVGSQRVVQKVEVF